MTIHDILEQARSRWPGKLAVVDGRRRWSYASLLERVAGLAARLAERGIGRQDRVAVLDVNSADFLAMYFAAARLGAVLVPLNHRLTDGEITEILYDAGVSGLVAGPPLVARADGIARAGPPFGLVIRLDPDAAGGVADAPEPAAVSVDDLAHLYYTSGTTGRSKGVMLTHRNVCEHAVAAADELTLNEDDIWAHVAPMFHLADAWATFAITWVGGRHVFAPRFEPLEVLSLLARERVSVTNLIPSMLNQLVKHPGVLDYDLSSFRLVMSGGAPIAPELVRRVIEVFGGEYVQTYGMTETSPYLTLSRLDESLRQRPPDEQLRLRARTGRPFKTIELEIVDDRNEPVPHDDTTVGEIRVRGKTVSPGYWRRPEETAEAFRDGWLYTGDLAVVNAEGFVNIVDRKKDTIITGGENVYSTEVEHVLYEHPAVLECAVIGVPDESWGEAVHAAVVLRPDAEASAAELIAFCKQHLAGFKVPKQVTFLDVLPKTGTGKIHKPTLRETFS
ncbi:MAG: long-chain-fatty-acid--CoA ligase [Acidobacteriota bacterium]|nr:MAG: long-chain-fatty-acid--CoA ligase [Acidobacteriota bacterium]